MLGSGRLSAVSGDEENGVLLHRKRNYISTKKWLIPRGDGDREEERMPRNLRVGMGTKSRHHSLMHSKHRQS